MQIVPYYETLTNYFCVFYQIVRNLEVADCGTISITNARFAEKKCIFLYCNKINS